MNDKAQIRLIEAHAKRHCRHQDFQLVLQKPLLKIFPLLHPGMIGSSLYTVLPQPHRHTLRILFGKSVDDTASGQLRNIYGHPRHSLSCVFRGNVAQPQALSGKRAANKRCRISYLLQNVLDNAIVRRSSSCQNGHI